MKISILGAGSVGQALAGGWAKANHQIIFGVRDSQSEKIKAALEKVGTAVTAATIDEAVQSTDVVVLALPWQAVQSTLESIRHLLTGKVLLDVTNPLKEDFSDLTIGHNTSGGEQVAAWSNGANVYKVFNQTGWETMADPQFGSNKAVMFVAGDNPEGKATTLQLAEDLGFDSIDAGPLEEARLLEPFGMLWIKLAHKYGQGRDTAFALLRR